MLVFGASQQRISKVCDDSLDHLTNSALLLLIGVLHEVSSQGSTCPGSKGISVHQNCYTQDLKSSRYWKCMERNASGTAVFLHKGSNSINPLLGSQLPKVKEGF